MESKFLGQSVIIDTTEKIITFHNQPNVFWVDIILKSFNEGLPLRENSLYTSLIDFLSYFKDGYRFIVDEHWEGHSVEEICSNFNYTFFEVLDDFKENYNIQPNFFSIITSNLYYYFYEPTPYIHSYLHWLHTDNIIRNTELWNNFENKSFYKKFVYLNRIPKDYRVKLYDKILKTNILDNAIWSWNSTGILYSNQKSNHINKALEDNLTPYSQFTEDMLLREPSTPHLDVFCSILVESEIELRALFISEKTAKCFIYEIPFVVYSSQYFLKTLKKLGFKTFSKWWDESYDLEPDLDTRIDKIMNVLNEINSKPIEELKIIYNDMKEILTFNKQHYKNIFEGKIHKNLVTKPKTFDKINDLLKNNQIVPKIL